MTIVQTVKHYTKKQGTKNAYQLESEKTSTITEQQYRNVVESASFFRRLGGSVTQQRNYTSAGYKVTKDISTSPNKECKTIREFTFEN